MGQYLISGLSKKIHPKFGELAKKIKSICDLASKQLQFDKKQKKHCYMVGNRDNIAQGKGSLVLWKDVNFALVAVSEAYKTN